MSDFDFPASLSRPRILLVDDTEINREIFGRILTAAEFDVDVVTNGEEACAATWGASYDLVLMDIEMPGMNGFEAAARIRAREGVMSGVKIAALTATKQPDAEQVSFWSGIDEFIPKPIQPKLLVSRVCELLDERRAKANDWKPVWRLAVFAKMTDRLDEDEAHAYLREFSTLLDTAEAAVAAKETFTESFHATIQDLLDLSSLLGFDEIAGLCGVYKGERGRIDMRCRDPNLLGAIDRARYAIEVYRREKNPTPLTDWWGRMRVNVQSLFKGKTSEHAAPAY